MTEKTRFFCVLHVYRRERFMTDGQYERWVQFCITSVLNDFEDAQIVSSNLEPDGAQVLYKVPCTEERFASVHSSAKEWGDLYMELYPNKHHELFLLKRGDDQVARP